MIHPDLMPLRIDTEVLIQDPNNARTHSQRNLDAIATSLERWGQRTPIVISQAKDGTHVVLKGNGTLQAALSLGWEEIAAIEVADTPGEAAGYAIADNRTAELADWHLTRLQEQIAELQDPDLIQSLGFDSDELLMLLGKDEPGLGELLGPSQKSPGELGDGGIIKDRVVILVARGASARAKELIVEALQDELEFEVK